MAFVIITLLVNLIFCPTRHSCLILYIKAKNRLVMNGFFDGILVEAVTVLLFGRLSKVSFLFAFIFCKNRSPCKPIPERICKEVL